MTRCISSSLSKAPCRRRTSTVASVCLGAHRHPMSTKLRRSSFTHAGQWGQRQSRSRRHNAEFQTRPFNQFWVSKYLPTVTKPWAIIPPPSHKWWAGEMRFSPTEWMNINETEGRATEGERERGRGGQDELYLPFLVKHTWNLTSHVPSITKWIYKRKGSVHKDKVWMLEAEFKSRRIVDPRNLKVSGLLPVPPLWPPRASRDKFNLSLTFWGVSEWLLSDIWIQNLLSRLIAATRVMCDVR